MNKVVKNTQEAIAGIESNMTLMLGGFGLCGIPENCIAAIAASDITGLICISNNAGIDGFGLGMLLRKHQIKMMISSSWSSAGMMRAIGCPIISSAR